ncbi:MAG: type II toxin-antitoxin system PemK/MazF family toxin [Candidatus Vogelbacteria bacterium]|nr:type II toxin-antitoxin system PemK/MazF family toxin [Candidatus Vogelbacteria bacterium]
MQDFDDWNEIKKQIEVKVNDPKRFPKAGEVWMCAVGRNIGFEQNGSGANFSRPVLIVKKFNNQMFWIASLSTKQKEFDFYYNFIDPGKKRASVILAQLKLVSVKRLKRKMYDVISSDLSEIKTRLRNFIS